MSSSALALSPGTEFYNDFQNKATVMMSYTLTDNQTTQISLAFYNIEPPSVSLFAIEPANAIPDPSAWFTLECGGNSTTVLLSQDYTWSSIGAYFFQIDSPIAINKECFITPHGQNMKLTTEASTQLQSNYLLDYFVIPDTAMSEMLAHVNNTASSTFVLFNIFLMVAGFLLVCFFIVFLWKIFEYFIKRSRLKEG
jgi:hypothetical protein